MLNGGLLRELDVCEAAFVERELLPWKYHCEELEVFPRAEPHFDQRTGAPNRCEAQRRLEWTIVYGAFHLILHRRAAASTAGRRGRPRRRRPRVPVAVRSRSSKEFDTSNEIERAASSIDIDSCQLTSTHAARALCRTVFIGPPGLGFISALPPPHSIYQPDSNISPHLSRSALSVYIRRDLSRLSVCTVHAHTRYTSHRRRRASPALGQAHAHKHDTSKCLTPQPPPGTTR